MNGADAAPFDIDRFAKVLRLVDGGATEGERTAARARAESIALASGLSFDRARLKATAESSPPPEASGWGDFIDEIMRKRWQEEAPKREEALREHGSRAAIFAESEREKLLREATAGLAWDVGGEDAPNSLRNVAMGAYPMPGNLADALAEWRSWWDLWRLRRLFDTRYETPPGVAARQERLEWMLDNWSDPTFSGLIARISWLNFWEKEGRRGYGTGETILALLSDVFMLKADCQPRGGGGGKNGHSHSGERWGRRTNAEKRAAVLEMLAAHPELSDGEIARRCGVSRQNVSNHRTAAARGGANG